MQSEGGSNTGQRETEKELEPQSRVVNDARALRYVCLFY